MNLGPVDRGLDGSIRANRFADSRESHDSRESFQGSRPEPLFCESRFQALKIGNRRFARRFARIACTYVMKIGVFLRIDSRESPRFALRIAGKKCGGFPDLSFLVLSGDLPISSGFS